MLLTRKDFINGGLGVAATAAAFSPIDALASMVAPKRKDNGAELNISFGEYTAPGETLEQRLDFMESHGVVGIEPNGKNLINRVKEFNSALSGRNIKVGAICAGFDGFLLSSDQAIRNQFDTTMRSIIEAAGQLGSVGVVMVPAFNHHKPCMPQTLESREYMVETLAKLGEFARSCSTSIILEPLNRREAFVIRQVADAASICRDTKEPGVKAMGDFWHMTWEETSDYGAFFSAGKEYLQHVHIASRGRRLMPGEDGEKDNYIDGFRALKELGYNKYVCFECGTKGDKNVTVPAALELMREQWKQA